MREGADRIAGIALLLSTLPLAACGRLHITPNDAGARDASAPDALGIDALAIDAAPVSVDAGQDAPLAPDDAAADDAWAPDAPGIDAWAADAWAPDAWAADAWAADAWAADAWAPDAWAPDAWAPDAWAPDAWSLSGPDLLGHYTFSGDGTDGTGTADLDCSGCTFFDGGVVFASDVAVPDRPELATGDYSFAAWVMVRSSQPLGTGMGVLTSADFSFEVDRNGDGSGGVTVYLPRSGGIGRAVPIDTWVHLCVTWNEAAMRVRTWLGGTALDNRVVTYRPASTGLVIRGGRPIDDLVLYDRELSMAEIVALAATRR